MGSHHLCIVHLINCTYRFLKTGKAIHKNNTSFNPRFFKVIEHSQPELLLSLAPTVILRIPSLNPSVVTPSTT